jgi:acetolactate synthase-1/2/3 large subunit
VQLTGAQALIRSLEQEGVDTIFGLPGGAILPVYDPLLDSSIRHILVRHEQGAGHMAEGYALATGRPGVAMVTSGPGATNIVTPIGNAHMDSTPLVVITGQVATASIGTDAFQECDITGITMGITKHNFLVQSAQEIPRAVAAAFHLATTGRPGPVLIDVPKDVTQSMMDWWYPASIEEYDLPGYRPEVELDLGAVERAVALIGEVRASGALRRRRHAEVARGRGVAGLRRAHGYAGRDHVDGSRGVPGFARTAPRHARHARHVHRGHRHSKVRPVDLARRALR